MRELAAACTENDVVNGLLNAAVTNDLAQLISEMETSAHLWRTVLEDTMAGCSLPH